MKNDAGDLTYHPGDTLELTFTITPDDASATKFHIFNPTGAQTTKAYPNDSGITRIGVGIYKFVLSIPDNRASVGNWTLYAEKSDENGSSLFTNKMTLEIEAR